MTATTKLYTAEELWHLPGDEPWELWEGDLRKVGGAGGEASSIAGTIYALMFPMVRSGRLGLLTTTDGTYILARDPDTTVVPDVGFVRLERLPDRARPRKIIPVPPDLVVEVQSPTDEPGEMMKKRALYCRAGVTLQWWVDPIRQTISVYRNGELVAELGEGDELDGENVLPGLRLPVADIFAWP